MVSIINAPTQDKPYPQDLHGQASWATSWAAARCVKYLNLTDGRIQGRPSSRSSRTGKVVWFGSDVGKFGEREKGIWDDRLLRL